LPNADRPDGAPAPIQADLAESFRVFGKIGLLNFGGPAAQIALMHRIFVDERRWLSETDFMHALNVCMLLPGPEALQVAIYAGWRRHGVGGGILAGLLFILPGFVVMLALSALYAAAIDIAPMAGLFLGIQAATIGIVIEALIKVAKRALRVTLHWMIAGLAFLSLATGVLPYWLVVILAGLAGYLFAKPAAPLAPPAAKSVSTRSIAEPWRTLFLVAGHGAIWLGCFAAISVTFGPDSVYAQLMTYFGGLAFVAFGGAYAMLSAVTSTAVHQFQWLSASAMVTGLGLAETTPGPLVLVLAFVGFQAAASQGLAAGVLGASVTALSTFLPSFLFVFLAAPRLESLRTRPGLNAALSGITAAVVGVIAHLSLWFALHFLFRTVDVWQPFADSFAALRLSVPVASSLDFVALALSAACAVILFRTRLGMIGALAFGAGIGTVSPWLIG
jgi:chromate transporter